MKRHPKFTQLIYNYAKISTILPFFISSQLAAQTLPAGFTAEELEMMKWYEVHNFSEKGITTPPEMPVRTMAEWEEIQALCITWTSFKSTLAQIILHAKEEVEVIIICSNAASAQNELLNTYGLPNLDNVTFLEGDYDSIWMRDYGPNTVYFNDVDSLATVEWIYNRPRPEDDLVPDAIGNLMNIPVYSTVQAPNDLVNTGGNFTADGMGSGFASALILEENEAGNPYGVTTKSEEQIDNIMEEWMGIDRYIKMETLPYDAIHHIDMHMKLLNEETILMGEYPAGEADGPQIEENLNYILDNFDSPFGTPYEVVRIQMPPHNGNYPDSWNSDYRTYTNSVFVNGTILVPVYQEQFDSTALRVYEENMPGYNVIGIDCNDIIQYSGALHCITRAIGVADPLLIIHQEMADQTDNFDDFEIDATVKHRSGISAATLYWTTNLDADYESIEMSLTDAETDQWTAILPNQGSSVEKIFYYIEGVSNSGKTQVRPLVAPAGYFEFATNFVTPTEDISGLKEVSISSISPNPVSTTASLSMTLPQQSTVNVDIIDVLGRKVTNVMSGMESAGEHRFFIDAKSLHSGLYFVRIEIGNTEYVKRLIVK